MRALHDQLAATLRYGAGFDPSKPLEYAESAAAGGTPSPQPAPPPTPVRKASAFTVDFSAGEQGWTGDHAALTIRPSAGPQGQEVLEAFTPGEGINGHIPAPPQLPGDWSGAAGLSVTLGTIDGSYVGQFDFGGRGGLCLASGSLTAAVGLPHQVSSTWQTMTVDFADPGWVLGGGARSVADVLANVTDFHLRVEFIEGDATGWISSVSLLPGTQAAAAPAPPAPPSVAPSAGSGAAPAAGGWTRYASPRFGTAIKYDAGLFVPQPAPENGDGQAFLSTDGQASFVVFGQINWTPVR